MPFKTTTTDILLAIKLAAIKSTPHLIHSWLLIPAGLAVMLSITFGVTCLFKHFNIPFPASVACLVLLFLGLLFAEAVLGAHRTRKIVAVVDVPAGWSLRWISVFFTPSFILLPLSPSISIREVGKIIGVFIIGFMVMMALAAYLTRTIQLLHGPSKRAQTRADEGDSIPLTTAVETQPNSLPASRPQTPPQLRLQDHHHGGSLPETTTEMLRHLTQDPPLTPRAERWAAVLAAHVDTVTYVLLLFFVGVPIYYTTHSPLVLHLTLTILSYKTSTSLPIRYQTYLHPVLTTSLLTILTIYLFAITKLHPLSQALQTYRTSSKYWTPSTPGAADILATLLDASITSLALPMFTHRQQLYHHYPSILIPSISISIGSLLAYPPLCTALGIGPERSLAFASRSLTLALAAPATENLGGDGRTAAALAIVSGIVGVVFGPWILGFLRIPEDDYVTRGITLGVNSSAIATALLLRTDPRAAALSSLSMIVFGGVTVLFTSIPPVVVMVRGLVGL